MSKIIKNNEPKEKLKKTEALIKYAYFVKASNQVDKSIDKLIFILQK